MTDRYLGSDGRGDGHFSVQEWMTFQALLVPSEVAMQSCAPSLRGKVLRDLRNDWPARRLQLRKRGRIGELRIELNPKFLEDRLVRFDVRTVIVFEPIPLFISRLEETRILMSLSEAEVVDYPKLRLLIDEFVRALAERMRISSSKGIR
jgi:hypothetical protein